MNAKDEGGMTPLHLAAAQQYVIEGTKEGEGYENVVRLLVTHSAILDARDNGGETPLHKAASGTGTVVAEFLLAKGADVNVENHEYRTPLALAVREGRESLAALLRRAGGRE